ncbi:MAG TPA: SPOR domain-containing protein [Rhizomicrobium sp.]
MARIEPGIYEPSDNRVFDAAEEEEQDEGSRLPLLIVIALLVLAAFAGVVWLAYTQGMARGRNGAPPVIMAAAGPAKVAPTNPGGVANPYKGLKIYEQPAPADEDDTGAAAVSKSTAAPTTTPTPPAAVATATPTPKAAAPAPILRTGSDNAAAATATSAPPKVIEAPASKFTTIPALPATAPPRSLIPQAAAPAVVKPTPAPVKVAEAPPPPKETPKAAPAPVAQVSTSGSYVLQIGSFKSQADADTAWKNFQGKHGSLVGSYGPNVVKVDLGEKGTWYRLRMGPFGSKDGAVATCAKLSADGASCIPAKG